ncbi:MAG: hypothetical protein E6I48_11345 [Chloroflexi bacterium]|nr:MAG: hypothetical protein E6I48_11345 [Chloroflexota bacterium]
MRAAAAFVALALGAVAPARGAIDASGKWSVRAQGTSGLSVIVGCLVDVAQSGTSFAITGSCELAGDVSLAGTFDPATGTFTASGHSEYYCSTLTIAGTVAADGRSFTGQFDCRGAFPVSGTFVGSRCGNGLLDAGEQCDDGNRVDGDCCSSSCRFEASGGACSDDGNPCTDRCDGAGRCVHDPGPDGLPCDPGNDCVLGGRCAQGVCVPGTPAPAGTVCAGAFDPCGENVCDGAGTCTHRPEPDGSPCTDWDDCTVNDACQGGVCRGTRTACGSCQACVPRLGCVSVSAPGCPPPKPARLPVTCRDGAPGAVFAYAGGPACMPYCDVDDKRDSVCTFRIPIAHGVEACRVKERVIAVPVGRRRRISGGDCRRPGEPSSGGYRLILHCRPHRQVPVCSLPAAGRTPGRYG